MLTLKEMCEYATSRIMNKMLLDCRESEQKKKKDFMCGPHKCHILLHNYATTANVDLSHRLPHRRMGPSASTKPTQVRKPCGICMQLFFFKRELYCFISNTNTRWSSRAAVEERFALPFTFHLFLWQQARLTHEDF